MNLAASRNARPRTSRAPVRPSNSTAFVSAVVLSLLTIASTAAAQSAPGRLVVPDEVALYVHSDLKHSDFVDPLVCALKRVLVAPVSTQDLRLPLGSDLAATPTQLDAAKLGNAFIRAAALNDSSRTFKYLLLGRDLKAAPWRYVFALSFGDQTTPYHAGIVSTARLDIGDVALARHDAALLTARRVYKLVLKSIARVAGYQKPEGCILAFPRDLSELDDKLAEFCPADRAAPVDAGILKAQESDECVIARRDSDIVAVAPPRSGWVAR
jgi:predicted Zn-dependent protease